MHSLRYMQYIRRGLYLFYGGQGFNPHVKWLTPPPPNEFQKTVDGISVISDGCMLR